jgi:hypothetical protein
MWLSAIHDLTSIFAFQHVQFSLISLSLPICRFGSLLPLLFARGSGPLSSICHLFALRSPADQSFKPANLPLALHIELLHPSTCITDDTRSIQTRVAAFSSHSQRDKRSGALLSIFRQVLTDCVSAFKLAFSNSIHLLLRALLKLSDHLLPNLRWQPLLHSP